MQRAVRVRHDDDLVARGPKGAKGGDDGRGEELPEVRGRVIFVQLREGGVGRVAERHVLTPSTMLK